MPETNVLNGDIRWRRDIDDAIGPDYGWERLRQSQLATAKAAGGSPFYRTVGNAGHSTQFSWLNRSRKCADFLKRWAEEHEDGFFTIIDQDGGGRHYVGTFTGNLSVTQAGNDRYNLQGWTFVETPGAPMLQYPDHWGDWSVMEKPWNDFGNLRTAFSGNWIRPAAQHNVGGTENPNCLLQTTPAIGDSITHEYRGYGLRVWCNTGPTYGTITIALDGTLMATVNLYAKFDEGPTIVYANSEVPLNIHRVEISVISNIAIPPSTGISGSGTAQGAGTGTSQGAAGSTTAYPSAPVYISAWYDAPQYALLTFEGAVDWVNGTVITLSGIPAGDGDFLNNMEGVLTFPQGTWEAGAQFKPTTALNHADFENFNTSESTFGAAVWISGPTTTTTGGGGTDPGGGTPPPSLPTPTPGGVNYSGIEVMR